MSEAESAPSRRHDPATCNCTTDICNGEGFSSIDVRTCHYCLNLGSEEPCPFDKEEVVNVYEWEERTKK